MRRTLALVLLLAAVPASASAPDFSAGGFLFTLQFGPDYWRLGRQHIARQGVGFTEADMFVSDAKDTWATVALRAGYNILGHATIEGTLTATGWSIDQPNRGGGGVATGGVRWHPLELVFMNKKQRPIPLDASIAYGIGWGIMGQRAGAQGISHMLDLSADYFFNRFFGLGFFARLYILDWDKFWIDHDNNIGVTMPNHMDGYLWHIGLSVNLRFGD
ncbi:MAG: hypothetical protein QM723_17655 [Myxococcaceae bacterium]